MVALEAKLAAFSFPHLLVLRKAAIAKPGALRDDKKLSIVPTFVISF
jgi:hypothetical protein